MTKTQGRGEVLEEVLVDLTLNESPVAKVFADKLADVDGLMKHGAYRYAIPGELDPDDMYQEGLFIMLNFIIEHPNLDPNSDEWKRLFRYSLFSGLKDIVRRTKRKKRDYRKKRPLIIPDKETPSSIKREYIVTGNIRMMHPDVFMLYEEEPTPEDSLAAKVTQLEIDRFLTELLTKLDTTQVILLQELLYPSPVNVEVMRGLGYERIHDSSYASIAVRLNWVEHGMVQQQKVRVHTRRIRREAMGIIHKYPFGREYLLRSTIVL